MRTLVTTPNSTRPNPTSPLLLAILMAARSARSSLDEGCLGRKEVDGEQQLFVGIHQAIKYRSLAAVDAGYPLVTSRVRSLVVAYATNYAKARQLADQYDIQLLSADRDHVLAPGP